MNRFFRWWARELAALVPRSLRLPIRPSARMLWLTREDGAMVFWRQTRGAKQEIGRVLNAQADSENARIAFESLHSRDNNNPVGICIPTGQVLRKEIELPLASLENLHQVLGFELNRITPFSAGQVYYAGTILREDRGAQRIIVHLTVAPRAPVDESIGLLNKWGVMPHAVVVADDLAGQGDCINLLPPERRAPESKLRYWAYAAMVAVTLGLLTAALVIPLWQKREKVIALQPLLAKAQQQAEAVSALSKDRDNLIGEYNYLLEQKLTLPPKVVLLEEISRLLPDGTWLQQLDINDGHVSMQGNTQSSSKLIGIFEKSTLLPDASFKSPLVKVQGGEERFHLITAIKTIPLGEALTAQQRLSEGKKTGGETLKRKNPPPDAGRGGKS